MVSSSSFGPHPRCRCTILVYGTENVQAVCPRSIGSSRKDNAGLSAVFGNVIAAFLFTFKRLNVLTFANDFSDFRSNWQFEALEKSPLRVNLAAENRRIALYLEQKEATQQEIDQLERQIVQIKISRLEQEIEMRKRVAKLSEALGTQ